MNDKKLETLLSRLKAMRLSGMADELKKQHTEPELSTLSGDERIERIISAESEVRLANKTRRMINSAGFRYPAAQMDRQTAVDQGADPDILNRLLEYFWIETGANLLITGPTGSGKSYFACALGIGAVSHNKTVRYERSAALLRELAGAENNGELNELLKKYSKYDLLILDDFGLMQLGINYCRNLFELLDSRDGKGSTIIISQLPVAQWYRLFEENTFADACLDRVVNTAFRIDLNGQSLRRVPA